MRYFVRALSTAFTQRCRSSLVALLTSPLQMRTRLAPGNVNVFDLPPKNWTNGGPWILIKKEADMKKSKFTEEQIVYALKQADAGVGIEELCRKYGISAATFYRWRDKYGGLAASELKRLKELEQENKKLKTLVADLALDKQILQDALSGKL